MPLPKDINPEDIVPLDGSQPNLDEARSIIKGAARLELLEYDMERKPLAAKIGIGAAALDREVKKARDKRQPPPSAKPDSIGALATDIIASRDVISLFWAEWRTMSAGEERNAAIIFLACVTRLFLKAMSVAIKGPSAGGKSEARKKVLKFMPPEDVVSFTAMSERALLYYEEDFPHKILSMGEAAGADEANLQDYLLRELLSEGMLRYPVAQKQGGEIITMTIEKNGPVCFLVTTTRLALHAENETRMLSIEVDDSEKQTRAVMAAVARAEGLDEGKPVAERLERWRDYQRWLAAGETRVIVPYAVALAGLITPKAVRLRRDFGQLLLAIKALAMLHREHRETDKHGRILANVEYDYRMAAELLGDIIAEAGGAKVKEVHKETVAAVVNITASLSADEGATVKQVGEKLGLDKSTASRRLAGARRENLITNLETRKGYPGRFRVADAIAEPVRMLPTAEEITVALGGVQHPQPCNTDGIIVEGYRDKPLHDPLQADCNTSDDGDCCKPRATPETRRNLPKTAEVLHGRNRCAGGWNEEVDI